MQVSLVPSSNKYSMKRYIESYTDYTTYVEKCVGQTDSENSEIVFLGIT